MQTALGPSQAEGKLSKYFEEINKNAHGPAQPSPPPPPWTPPSYRPPVDNHDQRKGGVEAALLQGDRLVGFNQAAFLGRVREEQELGLRAGAAIRLPLRRRHLWPWEEREATRVMQPPHLDSFCCYSFCPKPLFLGGKKSNGKDIKSSFRVYTGCGSFIRSNYT